MVTTEHEPAPNLDEIEAFRRRKVTTSHWDEERKQTIREVREASVVSVEEDLMVILGDSWSSKKGDSGSEIGRIVVNLLDVLATLVTMTSSMRSAPVGQVGKSASRPGPSFTPVWADRRLAQIIARISAETEALAGWLHRPYDPDGRHDVCARCSWKVSREHDFCPKCGLQRRHSA